MTDHEAEPPSTSPEPDDGDAVAAEPEDLGGGMENIADLIDEAARTAAEQAEREGTGEEPQDRSADVWGEDGDAGTSGAEAVWETAAEGATSEGVWAAAAEDATSEGVWGETGEDDDVWSDQRGQTPFAGADPVHEPYDTASPEGSGAETAPEPPVEPTEEPEAYTFAIDEPAGADADGAAGSGPAEEGQEPDDVWTSGVADATDEDGADGGEWSEDEAPLAESAQPRTDTGWRDLEAEAEPSWTLPDLPVREPAGADEEEPATFTAEADDQGEAPAGVDDHDGEDAVELPADVVTAEVHDALGDLLGNQEQDAVVGGGDSDSGALTPAPETTPEPAAEAPGNDPLGELADFDLDQFDDLDTSTTSPDAPAADDQESPSPTVDEEQPGRDDDGDDEDRRGFDDDEVGFDDRQLDAAAAARRVMEPGSVSFSSDKKKKRGFFR